VIGAEEGVEPLGFGQPGHGQLLIVRGALLWLGEDAKPHVS
jgi:hypothetical protein